MLSCIFSHYIVIVVFGIGAITIGVMRLVTYNDSDTARDCLGELTAYTQIVRIVAIFLQLFFLFRYHNVSA